jgi:hypothetical protein
MTRLARGRGVEGSQDEFTRAKEGHKRRNEQHLSYVIPTGVTAAPSFPPHRSNLFVRSSSRFLLFSYSPARFRFIPAFDAYRGEASQTATRVIPTNFLSALSEQSSSNDRTFTAAHSREYIASRLDIVIRLNELVYSSRPMLAIFVVILKRSAQVHLHLFDYFARGRRCLVIRDCRGYRG